MKKSLTILTTLFLFNSMYFIDRCHSNISEGWNLDVQEILRWRGQYYDLIEYENMLFVACKRGVEIYSLSDPAVPVPIGSLLTAGLANGLAINYPYLYVGDVYGFNVWEISDPTSPIRMGGFQRNSAEGYQERLLYRDGYVYAAAYSSGLQLIDVSDPHQPVIVAQADTPAYAWDLAISGDAVFLMDFFSMEIADVSRPLEPFIRTSYDAMFAGGIVLEGNLAYLAYIDGLKVLDVSDPFAPQVVSDIGPTGGGVAESITMKDHYAILAHQSYVEIYDVSDPSDPIQVAFFNVPGHPRKVLAVGDYLYTILDDDGFHVTDITDPEFPVPGGTVNPSVWGSRQDVVKEGEYLYLCDWNRGLVVYDTSDPETITEVGSYSTPGLLNDLLIDDDKAYLSCYSELQVVDISVPAYPQFLGYYKTSGNTWSIFVVEDRGYLCDLYSFQVLDISDPGNIQRIGAVYMAQDGTPYRCVVNGELAYIAHSWGGLKVIDISDPVHPRVIGSYPGNNSKSYTTIQLGSSGRGEGESDLLYVMDPRSVDIFSLESPEAPLLLNSAGIPDVQFTDFVIQDGYLYLSCNSRGIFVMDIHDPGLLFPVARGETPGDALGITADQNRIYVADDYELVVFERRSFTADTVPPEVVVDSPESGAVLTGKSAIIKGRAEDQDSGVKQIEISRDGGTSWQEAMGQNSWSYILTGNDPGEITLDVRITDWSGLQTTEHAVRRFTFLPDRPGILLAGFENSHVSGASTQSFTVSALVTDPYSPLYIDRIELYLNGESMGVTLEFLGESEGMAYYSAEVSGQFNPGDQIAYSLIAWDKLGNPSATWPTIFVRE
jgi:hypothetical protein